MHARTHHPRRAAGIAAATLLMLAAAACSGSGSTSGPSIASPTVPGSSSSATRTESTSPATGGKTTTYSAHGVSFDHPAGWLRMKLTGSTASSGDQAWNVTVGIDQTNFVTVARYTIGTSITRDNIQQQMTLIASQLTRLFRQAGGSLTSGPTPQTMGGLPALGFEGTASTPDGKEVTNHVVIAFDGTTEYFVNCQHDDQGASQIQPGCDTIVGSFGTTG